MYVQRNENIECLFIRKLEHYWILVHFHFVVVIVFVPASLLNGTETRAKKKKSNRNANKKKIMYIFTRVHTIFWCDTCIVIYVHWRFLYYLSFNCSFSNNRNAHRERFPRSLLWNIFRQTLNLKRWWFLLFTLVFGTLGFFEKPPSFIPGACAYLKLRYAQRVWMCSLRAIALHSFVSSLRFCVFSLFCQYIFQSI